MGFPAGPDDSGPRGGTETILLVEDERALLAVVQRLLLKLGYQVLAARSGAEALEVWKERGREIRLLLTDLAIPGGMSGIDLARHMQRESADLRVVYTSGWSVNLTGYDLPLVEGVNFLAKPYQLSRLAAAVRSALDAT